MIGTTRLPKESSRARFRNMRVNAMVELTAWSPDPSVNSVNTSAEGRVSGVFVRTTRFGSEPPSVRLRSIMYWYSTESTGGR